MSDLSRRTALLALAAVAAPLPAFALAADDNALVARAVAYLDGLSSVRARFTQTDDRGGVATGTLTLARPGRARFQYDPPSTLLITSDGETVTLTNSQLKTHQRLPLKQTPLAIFLADHIRLDKGAQVTRVDHSPDGFSVTARAGAGLTHGDMTLYFLTSPMRLTGWVVTDAQARTTRVTLDGLSAVSAPPASFFQPE
jgi:outer membrane lipoprotein-sorting protein